MALQHGPFWPSPSPVILSTTHESSSPGSGFCNCIFGGYHDFQQQWVGTLTAPRNSIQKTPGCRSEAKRIQVWLLQITDTLPGSHAVSWWYPAPTWKVSITNMPAPENQTEVKQFLGLVGYYCTFIPHFLDISRPLLKLMRKDTPFAWTKQCHLAFNMLKDKLCEAPILCYPDSSKSYMLFTNASKHRLGQCPHTGVWNWSKREGLERITPCHICQWFILR